MHQQELQFNAPAPGTPAELDLLLDYLLARHKWTTAAVITVDLGIGDRRIRALAAQSNQIVSGPGCPGYKHIRNTTPDEIKKTVSKLKSQGRKMWQRGQRLHSLFHKSAHTND